MDRGRRERGDNALLWLDLDQFKLVNDTSGHAAGDQLLRELAALLKSQLGDDHLAVRLGGDEFAVLLTDCDVERATDIAERLRDAIQTMTFAWEGAR